MEATKLIRGGNKQRWSNIELYRILCMLMIVAHHYVVNSGLTSNDGPMIVNPNDANTYFLLLFGMWGKTGINCFLLITGYFMCKSQITMRKLVKLLLWIYVYRIAIFIVMMASGYEEISLLRLAQLISPIWGVNSNFTSCFLIFWLTIPFWNILINNISKRQHQILLVLLLTSYTLLGSIPKFAVTFNYVSWFGVIYLISSYIRLYPSSFLEKKGFWGVTSAVFALLAMASVIVMHRFAPDKEFFFVADSNKFFAVIVAVSSFLWFKSLNIRYIPAINAIGGSTFGVLLIHANSDAMRTWLWRDVVDCVGHYSLSLSQLSLYCFMSVFAIFFICIIIDRIRIKHIEQHFFKWYDKTVSTSKLEKIFNV